MTKNSVGFDAQTASDKECEKSVVIRVVSDEHPELQELLAAFAADLAIRYPEFDGGFALLPSRVIANVVAYVNGEAVGCCVLRQFDAHHAEMKRLYVTEAARGYGAARAMMMALEEQARLAGYGKVVLGTGINQPEAIALYETSGYSQIDLFGEYGGDDICYEKILSPACGDKEI